MTMVTTTSPALAIMVGSCLLTVALMAVVLGSKLTLRIKILIEICSCLSAVAFGAVSLIYLKNKLLPKILKPLSPKQVVDIDGINENPATRLINECGDCKSYAGTSECQASNIWHEGTKIGSASGHLDVNLVAKQVIEDPGFTDLYEQCKLDMKLIKLSLSGSTKYSDIYGGKLSTYINCVKELVDVVTIALDDLNKSHAKGCLKPSTFVVDLAEKQALMKLLKGQCGHLKREVSSVVKIFESNTIICVDNIIIKSKIVITRVTQFCSVVYAYMYSLSAKQIVGTTNLDKISNTCAKLYVAERELFQVMVETDRESCPVASNLTCSELQELFADIPSEKTHTKSLCSIF